MVSMTKLTHCMPRPVCYVTVIIDEGTNYTTVSIHNRRHAMHHTLLHKQSTTLELTKRKSQWRLFNVLLTGQMQHKLLN